MQLGKYFLDLRVIGRGKENIETVRNQDINIRQQLIVNRNIGAQASKTQCHGKGGTLHFFVTHDCRVQMTTKG